MNYKEIFTENAVKQFKGEGATFVLLSVFNEQDLIRDIEVCLNDPNKIFAIAAKNTAAEAVMAKNFLGSVVNGEKWYPFAYGMRGYQPDKLLQGVAEYIKVDITDLKWTFIEDPSPWFIDQST